MLAPIQVADPQSGLSFSKAAGHLYRPLAADEGGQLLLWDREFGTLFDLEPELADYLAVPVYTDGGATVVFSKFEHGNEVLVGTRGLDQGARLPRNLYRRLCAASDRFHRRLEGLELSESQQGFLRSFALPDPRVFPAAYRVRQAGLFSRKKLFVLWGMVPEEPRAQPTLRMGVPCAPRDIADESGGGSAEDHEAMSEHPADGPGSQAALVYDEESDLPKWLQWLIWLLGALFLLTVLWLLLSLLLKGCESSESDDRKTGTTVPGKQVIPLHSRVPELERRLESLRKQPASASSPDRARALENAINRQRDAIEKNNASARSEARAKDAEAYAEKSDDPSDKKKAQSLRRDSDKDKVAAVEAQGKADRAFDSPQEVERLESLKDASPEVRRGLKSRIYVTPKASPEAGEILVRRFKPDEVVTGEGLRLHLEADANGRQDFKVKGWRLGLRPLVEKERLVDSVPILPELEIPLDLSFEYRGADGAIHQDSAPFTLRGGFEIIPHVEIEVFKPEKTPSGDDKSPSAVPPAKADPKKFG